MLSEKPKSILSVASDGLTKYLQTTGALEVIKDSADKLGRKVGQSSLKLIGILTLLMCIFY